MSTKTPGQRFAEQYGSRAVEEMLSAIKWSQRIALVLTLIVLSASFQHQMHFLQAKGSDVYGSIAIPVVLDLMILLCVKILAAVGMAVIAKRMALGFLILPITASATINFQGSPNATIGWAYVVIVAFIAAVEILKAFIRPDFSIILAEEARVAPAAEIGIKIAPAELARRTAKAALTREKNRIMTLRVDALRTEAAERGIETDGLRKPDIQALVIGRIEMDSTAGTLA